jgi:dTDP-4-dehydrorhamnose reductase
VNDRYIDQLKQADFDNIENVIEEIASLGIKTLRFPILWENHEPVENTEIDFSKTRSYLDRLNLCGIEPIAGLVHHGSGPSFTNLLDENFPEKLASYAAKVAREFPDIKYYTPLNEPLTTARFSGLYGLWYPHHRSDESFLKILLIEIKGIVLSMKAIREINPGAKLIQTEDLGKTYSTPELSYQANFENKRRWLTYDLLCGKVNEDHPLFRYFLNSNISEEELNFFLENPCVPDVAGFNYYVTSERFLDERLHLYPFNLHGGNQWHKYVDTEAVRVNHGQDSGIQVLLREAWERLQIPLALTEVHLNCTREEQLRWFQEIYSKCCDIKEEGIELIAITAWSLLGAFGWNRLLTCDQHMDYEPGAFQLSDGRIRKTALAKLIQQTVLDQKDNLLFNNSEIDINKFLRNSKTAHAEITDPPFSNNKIMEYPPSLLEENGWWNRSMRFFDDFEKEIMETKKSSRPVSPLLIIGKRGTLGNAFAKICCTRNIPFHILSRDQLNMGDPSSINRAIEKYKPWAIINAAGFVRVDDAEEEIEKCFLDNTGGPVHLAVACQQKGIKLMTFSSDLVFDGKKNQPYHESDPVSPLNVYGQSKAEKEKLVADINPDSLIIRTSAFFGPWDQYNFAHNVIRHLSNGQNFHAVDDIFISPTYVPDLVNASLDLLIDNENSIWHLSNKGSISWHELALQVASRAGFSEPSIIALKSHDMKWKAARPLYTVLQSTKGANLPSLENALDRFMNERSEFRIAMAV